jgi:hypothetical protein
MIVEDLSGRDIGRDDPRFRGVDLGAAGDRLAEVLAPRDLDVDPFAREQLRQGLSAGEGRPAEEGGGQQEG